MHRTRSDKTESAKKNKNLNSGYGQQSVAQKRITDANTKIDDPKKTFQEESVRRVY